MTRKKHIYDKKSFSKERKEASTELQKSLEAMATSKTTNRMRKDIEGSMPGINFAPPLSGIYGKKSMQPTVNFQKAENEIQLGHTNSNIVFGSDRPGSIASGWGSKGSNTCNTIDIVVGRMSSINKGDGPKEGWTVTPSFINDAARIYVSQLTDVDLNFGIVKGRGGMQKGRSAVAVKADGVRLVGREGVKIMTGRSFAFRGAGPKGEPNSRGGDIATPAPPIELLAGNNDSEAEFKKTAWLPAMTVKNLQGVAKGLNTRDALRDLSRVLEQLIGAVYNMSLVQTNFNSVVGINWQMPHYGIMAGYTGVQSLAMIQNSLWHIRVNKIIWELNYTYPFGYKYVTSKNVFST